MSFLCPCMDIVQQGNREKTVLDFVASKAEGETQTLRFDASMTGGGPEL